MIRTMSFLLCLVEMVHQCTGFEAVVIQEYSLSPSFWTLLVSDSDLPDISETIRQGVFDGRADIDIQSYKTTEYVRGRSHGLRPRGDGGGGRGGIKYKCGRGGCAAPVTLAAHRAGHPQGRGRL